MSSHLADLLGLSNDDNPVLTLNSVRELRSKYMNKIKASQLEPVFKVLQYNVKSVLEFCFNKK